MKTVNGHILEVRSLPTGQGTVIVALTGDLDLSSAPVLERELEHLAEAGARRVVIDATDLTFIDSSGIAVLVVAHRTFVERGGGLEVYNPGPLVRRTLDVTGVSQHLQAAAALGATPVASVGHDDPPAA
jgi:anti-sigma B factor antagonist